MNANISSKPAALRCADSPAPSPDDPAHGLIVGGLTPFSSLDFPGHLAAVVFVQGCAWRCHYCHNPHLQRRDGPATHGLAWPAVRAWLTRRVGLLDGVVFSGGEPTTDARLPEAITQVRALGLRIGLHTAGLYPERLQRLLPLVDWVGLDIKAPLSAPGRYAQITGVPRAAQPVQGCLQALIASGIDFECRTTAHPQWLDEEALRLLADELSAAGVKAFALQVYRPDGAAVPCPAAPAGYPSPALVDHLQSRFEAFTLRG